MEFRLQASKMANKNTVRLSVDNAYNKLMICIFAWLKKLGEEDTTKFKYIARFGNYFKQSIEQFFFFKKRKFSLYCNS